MRFKEISIRKWQQFNNVEFKFNNTLTIISGANGTGKTTILNILALHEGWPFQSLSTPKQSKNGDWKYVTNYYGEKDDTPKNIIGTLHYSNQALSNLSVPETAGPQYQIEIMQRQNVPCFFIPSHRAIFRYQQLTNINTQNKNKKQAFDEVSNSNKQWHQGANSQSPSFLMKNTLISWAIKGYGIKDNDKFIMPSDENQITFYEGFQKILKRILPKSLRFEELEIRNMEIVFVCNGGTDDFILETASGGISALIDLAWQIYMYSTDKNYEFSVLIDEVENHLHPTMQRKILPDLMSAFPNAKFIVVTHSPLIVNSCKDASVYVLDYDENKKIVSRYLDFKRNPKTANEILNDVLGVATSFPIWVEDELNRIIEVYKGKLNDRTEFRNLREDLGKIGLEKLVPETVDMIIGEKID